MNIHLQLTETPLDVMACIDRVASTRSGGIDVFIGTVRDSTQGKKVIQLAFEAYEPMAMQEMRKIAERTFEKWPVHAVAIHHRTGTLELGDIAVVIAVAAAHRVAAFDACRYAIDTLKETVPIWKKEVFTDGAVWVAAHP